jgi:hypothetical protein
MFPGPRLVLSDDIPSISCKDLAPCGLLERMNFHPGTSYPLEPARKSLLERALHYSCDFGVAYALLRSRWSMDPGDAEKQIDECRSVHNTTRQDFSVNGALSGMIPRRMWDLWSNRVVPIWMVVTDPATPVWYRGETEPYEVSFFAVSHPRQHPDQRPPANQQL